MIPDEIPDFSRYSLRELREVAEVFVRERDVKCHTFACEEIARREAETAARPEKLSPPFYCWIFETGNNECSSTNIANWWKERYVFWLCFIAVLYFSSALTSWFLLTLPNLMTRSTSFTDYLVGSASLVVLALVFGAPFFVVASVVYMLMTIVSAFAASCVRFRGWHLTVSLFTALLVLAIILASLLVAVALSLRK